MPSGQKIDLLRNYPKANRDLAERAQKKTEQHREIARKFGEEFFDGDRSTGYGGFSYNPRFWQPVIPDLKQHFSLSSNSSVLDVGCAKGFMLVDLQNEIPGIALHGIDVSEYAIGQAHQNVRNKVSVGNAKKLDFDDDTFDVVISINTIHNLELEDCKTALKEIERVARYGSFITVDAYITEEEKIRMFDWNLTAKTILSETGWENLFDEVGFTGDYFWFTP